MSNINIIDVNLKYGTVYYRSLWNLTHIVIHHIMHRNATVNDIHNWHRGFGWSGIGYHYYIRKNGRTYKGRNIDVIGAHVAGKNTPSIGIALEGDFRYEIETEEQRESLKKLIKHINNILKRELIITTHRKFVNNSSCPEKFDLEKFLKYYNKNEVTDLEEALKVITDVGIINSPAYWRNRAAEVKYFDIFIKNVANYVVNNLKI